LKPQYLHSRASGKDLNAAKESAVPTFFIVFYSNYGSILFSFRDINQSINEISIAPPTKSGRRRLTM